MNESPMDFHCLSAAALNQVYKVVNKVTISLSSLKCVSHIGRLLKTETEIY